MNYGGWKFVLLAAFAAAAVLATPAFGVRTSSARASDACKKVPDLLHLQIAGAMTKAEDAGCGVPVDQPMWTGDNTTVRACRHKAGEVMLQSPAGGKPLKGGHVLLATCPFVVHGKPAVHVVYAVPAGQTWNQDDTTAIGGALASLQSFYLDQVGGKTFSYTSTLLCTLPYPAHHYLVDTWNKLLTDLQPCANVTSGSSHADWVVYANVDHKCNTAGPIGEGEAGLTFLGVQDLSGLIGGPVSECGQSFVEPPSRYVGGLGHEMGHTFGLPHPPGCDQGLPSCDTNALMWQGYAAYPNTYLRQDEITPLRKSPYFWKTTADGH